MLLLCLGKLRVINIFTLLGAKTRGDLHEAQGINLNISKGSYVCSRNLDYSRRSRKIHLFVCAQQVQVAVLSLRCRRCDAAASGRNLVMNGRGSDLLISC